MRKILISILLILLIILAYFTIFQGISLGTFKISSVADIINANKNLTQKIDEANKKIKVDQNNKNQELYESVKTLSNNKEEYYKEANTSTENDIKEANTDETYTCDFLWLRVGNHAREEGVNLKMEIKNDNFGDQQVKDLSFTVEGKYYGIIDFISAVEEDSKLNFRIDNFKMVEEGENLKATFDVSNIKIKDEKTTQNVETTNNTKDANTNTTDTNKTNEVADTNSITQ